ncbi:hypothetical protein HPB52_008548 [Rhipicephalus sanguineus]|uniref:Uncharacterized protein n=1 Tax=Rhipicephalus sanguineus TaxID=34632 RepID=A0A9D4Q5N6_RHISA|nr:hypothetical protein HPB52_008548 [Rhipicephalus sanguineus]
MEPPLSVVLRFGFRPISGVAEFFRPNNLRKRKKLVNAKYVYDVQELEGTVSARCNSQGQRISRGGLISAPKLIEAVNLIDLPNVQVQGNRLPAYGLIVPTYSSSRRSQNMETLKLKREAERLKLTRLINKIEAMLTKESVTEEELCILNEHLKHLHNDLRATDSHIVPLLSTTVAQAELYRVVDYNARATVTSAKLWYRIRQLQESKKRVLLAMSTEPVQRTPTLLSNFRKLKFDDQPLLHSGHLFGSSSVN